MKNLVKPNNLPLITVVLGGIGFVLRWLLYTFAVDEKNLILSGHLLEISLWLVTLIAAALTAAAVKKADLSAPACAPSLPGTVGTCVLAAGILLSTLGDGLSLSGLEGARDVLGCLAVLAAVILAFFHWKGQKPSFLLYVLICVFFAVHMVSRYQFWSRNPQLQDYVFTLFSCVGLMLFSYQQAAFLLDSGSRRTRLGVGLLTIYTCLVAISTGDNAILYAAGGIWVFASLYRRETGECAYGSA